MKRGCHEGGTMNEVLEGGAVKGDSMKGSSMKGGVCCEGGIS